jgi:Tfp pilus assembly protein PilN
MRPVNLIPSDERRGEQAPLRSGALVYLVVGAFVAILVGVTSLVLIGNKVTDRKGDVVQLHRENTVTQRKAQRLASYTQFRTLSEQRVQTVSSLAESRFDWERVMRELALVLPHDVWLINMNATATVGINVEGASSGTSDLRSQTPGPALELKGCATGQEAVAGLVTVLKDIDGVTRVGMKSSELPGEEGGAGTNAGSEAGGEDNEDCRTRKFITEFEMVVAFDAAPIPVTGSGEGEVTTAPEGEEAAESSEGETEEG